MTTTPSEFSSADLLVLQRQLEDWRSRQSGRPRLPSAVWEAAAALACSQGASRVARILRLSYPGLLARMRRGAARAQHAANTAPARFIELKCSPPPEVGWAELRDGSGRVLHLRLGRDPEAWRALSDSFWRHGR